MTESYHQQIIEQDNSDSSPSHSIEFNELNNLRENPLQHPSYAPINIQEGYLIQEDSIDTSKSSECDVMAAIGSQTHKILQIEEQLYYFRSECFKLMQENNKLKDKEVDFQRKILQLKISLKRQREISDTVSAQLQRKNKEINELRKDLLALQSFYPTLHLEQIQLQKQAILDLTTKNEKIMRINQFLQQELKTAERKLVQVENDMQMHMCSQLNQNVARFKQNQNYINNDMVIKIPPYVSPLQKNNSNISKHHQVDKNFIQIQSIDSYRERKQFKTLQKDRIRQSNQRNDNCQELKSHRLRSKHNEGKKYRFD